LQPIIEGNFYTWSDFIAEYSLCIETTFIYEPSCKTRRYFVRVGKFQGKSFTVVNQTATKFKYNTIRDRQKLLIFSIAADDSVSLLSTERPITISPADSTCQQQQDINSNTNYCSTMCSDMDMNYCNTSSSSINFKNIIQMHFFEKIMKDGTKSSAIWMLIDDWKLKDGLHELFESYHWMRFDAQKQMMAVLNESSGVAAIVPDKEKFPMINQFGIPFSNSVLQSLVHDIVSIQDKTNVDLLTFNSFNGKHCCLVQPIQSSSYHSFKQNIRQTKSLIKYFLQFALAPIWCNWCMLT
jgi:hypothetical protein